MKLVFFQDFADIYNREEPKTLFSIKKMVEKIIFLKSGKKEVIRFIAAPQSFNSDIEAIIALESEVRTYELTCGKGYNKYITPDNPFVAIIIHGINE